MKLVIICLSALFSTTVVAQGLPELEKKVEDLTTRVASLEAEVNEIKKGGKNIAVYKEIPVGVLKPNQKTNYTFKLKEPGMLISTLNTRVHAFDHGKQHTIESKSFISVNGKLCAYGQSAYYVWNGHSTSNATCIIELSAGEHELQFHPAPAFWPAKYKHKSDSWAKYTVLRK